MAVVYLDAHQRVHAAWQAQAELLDGIDEALGRGRHAERPEWLYDALTEGIMFHEGEPPPPPDDVPPLD
jgi:hypothetical protein